MKYFSNYETPLTITHIKIKLQKVLFKTRNDTQNNDKSLKKQATKCTYL